MQVAEVTPDECKPFVVHNVALCILILIETEQLACGGHGAQDFFRVSSSSECNVYVSSSWLYVHTLDAFMQEDGNVVCLFWFVHFFLTVFVKFLFIIYQGVKLGNSVKTVTMFWQLFSEMLSTGC